jgi:tRNA pseudouridine38-40 synthase
LTIAYLGTAYGGWQRQSNSLAVQQVVEEAVEAVVGEPVSLVAAGRTDAGVHARAQEAHLRLAGGDHAAALVAGVNHYLPADVRVLAARRVCPGFHARAWAIAKEYHYSLRRVPVLSPFEAATTVRISHDVDVALLREAAGLLVGRHDFAAFARSGGSHRSSLRRIFVAEVLERGDDLCFRVIGDGFLRGMVRALVGTLLEVSRGRRDLAQVARLLKGGRREDAGPSAPARGLAMVRVYYPEDRGWDVEGATARCDSLASGPS